MTDEELKTLLNKLEKYAYAAISNLTLDYSIADTTDQDTFVRINTDLLFLTNLIKGAFHALGKLDIEAAKNLRESFANKVLEINVNLDQIEKEALKIIENGKKIAH